MWPVAVIKSCKSDGMGTDRILPPQRRPRWRRLPLVDTAQQQAGG